MSVYTPLNENQIIEILSNYSIGKRGAVDGIKEGITNSNYFLKTSVSEYVLTIFEDNNVNLDYVIDDVFNWAPTAKRIKWCDLIINTSCEHMRPMKELNLNTNAYFAYTSNNMFDIKGHINCVNNIEEFKKQLPDTAKVLSENEVTDERGSRYLIVGKYEKSNI